MCVRAGKQKMGYVYHGHESRQGKRRGVFRIPMGGMRLLSALSR